MKWLNSRTNCQKYTEIRNLRSKTTTAMVAMSSSLLTTGLSSCRKTQFLRWGQTAAAAELDGTYFLSSTLRQTDLENVLFQLSDARVQKMTPEVSWNGC